MTTESLNPQSEKSLAEQPLDDNQIIAERRNKLAAIRKAGIAYPNDFNRTDLAGDLYANHEQMSKAALETAQIQVAVAGRMMLKRVMGKASFATLQDMTGRLQLYISNGNTGEAVHSEFKHYDLGDILGAVGVLFKTKTGELSVRVSKVRLLTKSLRPLPEKFHGLADQEQKYRQRYLDLITNEDTRRVFLTRTKIIQAIREFFINQGYIEVETPMMHAIPGGASAKPFETHHNALDMQMFLRVAPELYLKQLVIGGFEKVFEINRNFRNEGLSTRHNPEFTMLEFYEAYRDYRYLMDLTEKLLNVVAQKVLGTTVVNYQGKQLDLARPFHRLTMVEAVQKYHPQFSTEQLNDREFVLAELKDLKAKHNPQDGIGGLQLSLFEELSEALLFEPTFIIDYPVEVSPLARSSDTNPEITERFELFILGRELANGFSELNDSEDQEARFDAQVAAKDAGDEEAMFKDNNYVRALEYGLPPTAGEGIGIDRLIMMLTDCASIRDVILFPQMRPE
ncbi:MAG: lysine--tRNA ligase [Gallionella sp.]